MFKSSKTAGVITLALCVLMIPGISMAAQRVVVFENFTATWCTACPPVRQDLQTLSNQYGDDIAVVQVHGSDDYTIAWGNTRMSHYNLEYFPTVWMDGVTEWIGDQGISVFRNAYLARRGVASPVAVEAGAVNVSGTTWDVSTRITADPGVSTQTFKIHTLILLGDYPSGSYYDNCLMQARTSNTKTLSAEQSIIETNRFTFGSSWNQNNVKILIMTESTSSGTILNAAIISQPFQPLDIKGDYDRNGMIDLADYAFFPDCLSGPGYTPSQTCLDVFDFDDDRDVDLVDFAAFQEAFTGTCPSIISSPDDELNCEGELVTFSVTAEGTEPLTYQWEHDGDIIPGATDPTLEVVVSNEAAGNYTCVVSNMCGSIESAAGELSVAVPPTVGTQPQSMTKCVGEIATFTARFNGMRPITYQWTLDGVDIDGATDRDYTIDAVDTADAGTYVCIATNPCGSTISNDAALTISEAPEIVTQPVNTCAEIGETAEFTTELDGVSPFYYAWYKDGQSYQAGLNLSTLTITDVSESDAGTYYFIAVSFSYPDCEVMSDSVTLQAGGCD